MVNKFYPVHSFIAPHLVVCRYMFCTISVFSGVFLTIGMCNQEKVSEQENQYTLNMWCITSIYGSDLACVSIVLEFYVLVLL